MSDLIDRCRIAAVGVIQNSNLPVGASVDSEKLVLAILGEVRDAFGAEAVNNSSLNYASDEIDDALRKRA